MFVLVRTKGITLGLRALVSPPGSFALCSMVLLLCASEARSQLYGLSYSGTFDDPELHLITIDPATGAGTIVANVSNGNLFTGLAFDGRQFFTVDSNSDRLYSIDFSGKATLIGATGVNDIEGYLAYDADSGTLFGGWRNLYSLNTSNGSATFIGATGLDDPSGLDFDSHGNGFLFDTKGNSNNVPFLYSIDTNDGSTARIGSWRQSSTFPSATGGLAFIDDQLYGLWNDSLYAVDMASGSANLVGAVGLSNYGGLTFVVPEPATTSFAAFGAISFLLLFLSRRRAALMPSALAHRRV